MFYGSSSFMKLFLTVDLDSPNVQKFELNPSNTFKACL